MLYWTMLYQHPIYCIKSIFFWEALEASLVLINHQYLRQCCLFGWSPLFQLMLTFRLHISTHIGLVAMKTHLIFLETYMCLKSPYFLNSPRQSNKNRSLPWLLMPWLLALPDHQALWHWQCRRDDSFPFKRKDFNCMLHLHLKMKMHTFNASSEQYNTQWLKYRRLFQ